MVAWVVAALARRRRAAAARTSLWSHRALPQGTTTTNPYAVPPVIDEPYVNRVLAGLDHSVGDAVRLAMRTRLMDEEVFYRLQGSLRWRGFPATARHTSRRPLHRLSGIQGRAWRPDDIRLTPHYCQSVLHICRGHQGLFSLCGDPFADSLSTVGGPRPTRPKSERILLQPNSVDGLIRWGPRRPLPTFRAMHRRLVAIATTVWLLVSSGSALAQIPEEVVGGRPLTSTALIYLFSRLRLTSQRSTALGPSSKR